MLHAIAIAGAALSLLAPPLLAEPAVAAPSGKVTIDVVTVNGSGCPAGTTDVAVSTDNTAFTVTYGQYLAQAGGGADVTDARKNCQLNLLVHVPSGLTFAVAQVDYHGHAKLDRGASASERANYYFTGDSANAVAVHSFNGPLSDDWHATDRVADSSLVFAPCGVARNLNVASELRVTADVSTGSTSYINMKSTRGSVSTIFHLAWRSC